MSFGDTALLSGLGYIAVGRETVSGTYNTCTAALNVLSCGLVTKQEDKILEQIESSRTYSQQMRMTKEVGGPLSFYYSPNDAACNYLLQNAMNTPVTSVTATGETIGGDALEHTFGIGNSEPTLPSLCINVRKGPSSVGRVWQYHGLKVNEITFSAALDEPLKCDMNLVGLDSTQVSNDVQSALTVTSAAILSFAQGRLSVEQSFASLTSSSYWHVEAVEWGWNNNIKTDAASGRIGSDVKMVLPLGMCQFNCKATVRFNTTTAYDAMLGSSQLSMQLEFVGDTITGSVARRGIKFNFPKVYVKNAGDPAINGPNEILTSEIEFDILRDTSSASGYALQAIVTNTTTGY